MLLSPATSMNALLSGVTGLACLTTIQPRTLCSITSDDGLTGGGIKTQDASDEGPFVIDSGALRKVAQEEGDGELNDLLDRLKEVSERFLGHAQKQLDALKAGKAKEAKEHYDNAMELSLPWHRLMKDIHEHAKRKGYYG